MSLKTQCFYRMQQNWLVEKKSHDVSNLSLKVKEYQLNILKDKTQNQSFCTVGRNANWYSYYGEQYGVSLKN